MLSSQTTYDFDRSFEPDDAEMVGEPLTAYLEEARGAFSHNTERALRADVQVFAAWCRQHFREAFPASAATVVAFVDDMGRVKTPATVRRYVSSIATLHKALRQANPLDSASVRFALQRMHRLRGRRQAQVQGLDVAAAEPAAGGGRRPADRRPEPCAAGGGLRHAAAALRAGIAGSA